MGRPLGPSFLDIGQRFYVICQVNPTQDHKPSETVRHNVKILSLGAEPEPNLCLLSNLA